MQWPRSSSSSPTAPPPHGGRACAAVTPRQVSRNVTRNAAAIAPAAPDTPPAWSWHAPEVPAHTQAATQSGAKQHQTGDVRAPTARAVIAGRLRRYAARLQRCSGVAVDSNAACSASAPCRWARAAATLCAITHPPVCAALRRHALLPPHAQVVPAVLQQHSRGPQPLTRPGSNSRRCLRAPAAAALCSRTPRTLRSSSSSSSSSSCSGVLARRAVQHQQPSTRPQPAPAPHLTQQQQQQLQDADRRRSSSQCSTSYDGAAEAQHGSSCASGPTGSSGRHKTRASNPQQHQRQQQAALPARPNPPRAAAAAAAAAADCLGWGVSPASGARLAPAGLGGSSGPLSRRQQRQCVQASRQLQRRRLVVAAAAAAAAWGAGGGGGSMWQPAFG
jgi:hypothetical protein